MDHLTLLDRALSQGSAPEKQISMLRHFCQTYLDSALNNGCSKQESLALLKQFISLILQQINQPFVFEPFHRAVKSPFNYYKFGVDLVRPLVKVDQSGLLGEEVVQQIERQLSQGANVVLFANHQIEPDPQVISLLLENLHPELAEEMIFVAGHRVTTDPMAAALSIGRNLFCIYSKNYIEHPPELKAQKIRHNQRTIRRMASLLDEGGHCIYVAPSGGRDRLNAQGELDVARFDPQNIDLFLLLARQSKRPVHFYPLALYTYELMPPPSRVEIELGELRSAHAAPLRVAFGQKIIPEVLQGDHQLPKENRSVHRAHMIWQSVRTHYRLLVGDHHRPYTQLKAL